MLVITNMVLYFCRMAKEELGTHEAFERLVNSPYYWTLAGGTANLRRQFVSMLKNGKGVSLDKKEEWLARAGFSVKQEKSWHLPS